MYKLNLVFPVILSEEIDRIAEETGFKPAQIRQLAGGDVPPLGIVIADHEHFIKFDLIPMTRKPEDDEPMAKTVLTGPFAVIWLCLQKGVVPCFLTRIEIPDDLFPTCSAIRWHDISSLFFEVSLRNSRAARLAELHAPDIIIRHEIKMLWEATEALEYGKHGGPWGLNTSGYSLMDGWFEGAAPNDEDAEYEE